MSSGLFRSGAVISAMTMISRILGLVRDMVVARYFEVSGATDAFFVAFRIPNLLRRFFAEGAFSLAFVPVLSEYRKTRTPEALRDL
nr:lipid II flippase MurJ [Thiolinea sp.]